MPRINRKIRVRPQNRVTRAQILELLIGPSGQTVFGSAAMAHELWARVEQQYSPDFASRWFVAQSQPKPFCQIALQYARRVVAGEIPACKWTKKACWRHLRDLEKAAAGNWQYVFDESRAARACRFLELLPHTKGKWAAAAELMTLEPWQVFIIAVLFGWVKRESGLRRFSVAYIKIPRKNGKSQLAAGIGLYLFACDGEFGAEVYSGATNEKQAHEVFRPARQMMERSVELAQALGVLTAAKRISKPEDGSRFEVVVGKPGDGASPHGGIVDEYHEHDTDTLFDTFRTGMGARQQPLLFVITTAGDNVAGPCKLLEDDVCKVLDGSLERDDIFAISYGIDEGDSWADPAILEKANPNVGVSVFREFLLAEQSAALLSARKQGVFQTKHLNVWVGAVASYFDVHKFRALGNPELRIEDFIGGPCAVAGDLSTKRDFTARIVAFCRVEGGKRHYYLFSRFWLPQQQIDRPDTPHYREWASLGHIHVHSGATVDFELIENDLVDVVRYCQASEFAFDPWNAHQLAQAVQKRTNAEIVEMNQVARVLSAPMKEMDVAIAEGRLHHDGNPVLVWMVGNVKAKEDANENVFPRKESGREEAKIDGAVASIMAVARVEAAESETFRYTGLRSV